MSTIVLNNSFCTLTGFPAYIMEQVKTKLTYADNEVMIQKQMLYSQMSRARGPQYYQLKARFQELGPDYVCMLDKNNRFPTGLLHIVRDVLTNVTCNLDDRRIRPEPCHIFRWNNEPPKPRYYQQEAVNAFVSKGRGILNMACGSGKTFVAARIIKELGVNTLFVVPSSALLTQAYDVFVSAFGSKNVQKICSLDIKKNKSLKPIKVVTVQTMSSLLKQDLLKLFISDVNLIVWDECHHAGAKTYHELLNSLEGIYYRLSMSATPVRNDSKTYEMLGVCDNIIYEYNAAKATREGYLCPVQFKIITLNGKYSRNYQQEYRDNYSSMEFLDNIKTIIQTQIPKDSQTLVLVDRKERCGHLIHEYLNECGIENTYVTGDNSSKEVADAISRFNDKKINILIASTVLGEGCDIRSTSNLILARGGKSEIAITQAIGRSVRLFPGKDIATVWDFNFRFCKYLPRHLKERCEIYSKQFAGEIVHL